MNFPAVITTKIQILEPGFQTSKFAENFNIRTCHVNARTLALNLVLAVSCFILHIFYRIISVINSFLFVKVY